MGAAEIAALCTGLAGVIGAVTALIATWRHANGPGHSGTGNPGS